MTLKERLILVLAEAGLPAAIVTGPDDDPVLEQLGPGVEFNERVAYLAFRAADAPLLGCYSCWLARLPCSHG